MAGGACFTLFLQKRVKRRSSQTSQPPPQDEDGPVEGSAHSGQESLDTTSIRGDLPSDSQEEVIIHVKEEEIDSLC